MGQKKRKAASSTAFFPLLLTPGQAGVRSCFCSRAPAAEKVRLFLRSAPRANAIRFLLELVKSSNLRPMQTRRQLSPPFDAYRSDLIHFVERVIQFFFLRTSYFLERRSTPRLDVRTRAPIFNLDSVFSHNFSVFF